MDETDITPAQAELIGERVRDMLAYLHNLRRRMEARGFPVDDPLWLRVDEAYEAVHQLRMALHYLTCPSGAGRPRREG